MAPQCVTMYDGSGRQYHALLALYDRAIAIEGIPGPDAPPHGAPTVEQVVLHLIREAQKVESPPSFDSEVGVAAYRKAVQAEQNLRYLFGEQAEILVTAQAMVT
jgi:hypothetical protein